jgi:hypothetical protein
LADGQRSLTNYKACAAASLISAGTPASTDTAGGGMLTKHVWSNEPTLRANVSYGGIDTRQAGDGLSKTVMIGEVCEATVLSSWARGETCWITPGADVGLGYTSGQQPNVTKVAGRNISSTPGTTGAFYSGSAVQGLGSFHTGNLILHAYGDGHTSAISADVDRMVLGSVYTRNNGEAVAELP